MIYDISRTIQPTTAVWPGDARYVAASLLRKAEGASVNLTTLTLSPHTGSHADAYYHYADDGAFAANIPLYPYLGPAYVVTVDRRDGALLPNEIPFERIQDVERLLIHSQVSDLPDDQFPTEFPYLSVELIEIWAVRGGRLIGLDSPSVDAFDSKDLPCHHALRRHGMVNLECLCLRGVPDGLYELIALPLKLELACASPVRAILRDFEEFAPDE